MASGEPGGTELAADIDSDLQVVRICFSQRVVHLGTSGLCQMSAAMHLSLTKHKSNCCATQRTVVTEQI